MLETGIQAELKILRTTDRGFVLDGCNLGEIFLPGNETARDDQPDTTLTVFLYNGSDGEPTATLRTPKIRLGEFASLRVVSSTRMGAFANWGLKKDLYIPITEQQESMQEGEHYIIRLIHDKKDGRLIGTSRINRFLDLTPAPFEPGEKVSLLIYRKTDLGFIAIINNSHTGILYKNEIFQKLRIGMRTGGYISKIREDGKIDLRLAQVGAEGRDRIKDALLDKLQEAGGFLPLNDKSPAEDIYATFGESKKSFKKALGALYKERVISITPDGISLTQPDDQNTDNQDI